MKAFTFGEVENIFEIGRIIQALISKGHIKYYESKEAFLDAVAWAIEFEREHKDTEDVSLFFCALKGCIHIRGKSPAVQQVCKDVIIYKLGKFIKGCNQRDNQE